MNPGRNWFLIAPALGVINAVAFVFLVYFAQAIVDSTDPTLPWWFVPAFLVLTFPGRYLFLLPALNHPLGFGNNDDRNLYLIAAFNGLLWAAAVYGLAALAARRRQRARPATSHSLRS